MAAAFVLTDGAVRAATFYVSKTGSDSNSGSQSQPWLTLQHASDSALAGDTIRVGSGVFDETVKVSNAGTSTAPITLDGQGVATVRRLWIENRHIYVTGFTLTGDPAPGSSGIQLHDGAHFAVITNNVIDTSKNLGVAGIQMSPEVYTSSTKTNAPRSCLIISNKVSNIFGSTAILVAGRNNLVTGNTVSNVYTADFLRLFGHTNIIRNNRFINNFYQSGIGNHPDFVQTFGELNFASIGHVIENNLVKNIENGQLSQMTMVNSFDDGQHGSWIIRNNVFVDIALQASAGIPNNKWLNNVFLRCAYQGGPVLAFGYTEGRSNAEGAVVLNNVFLDCGVPGRDNSGWYSRGISDLTADFNYVAKGSGYAGVREENPPSDFRWYEPNGINGGDPRFVNESQLDFRLRSDSPLVDRGVFIVESAVDAIGSTRPQGLAPDIGAYEFVTGSSHPSPPTGLQLISHE